MNWNDLIHIEALIEFLLIFFRVGGLFIISPLLGNRALPSTVKIAISIMISLLLLPLVDYSNPLAQQSNLFLGLLILEQVTIGIVVGYCATILFDVVRSAGEVFGVKVGFAMANLVDPANEGSAGILASLYVLLGGIIFLYLNGHHILISAILESFKILPIGEGFNFDFSTPFLLLVAKFFAMVIKISAPILIVLTILNIIFGLITKLSPQMNIYFNVGFILGPVTGIIILMATLPLLRIFMENMVADLRPELITVIRSLKGI